MIEDDCADCSCSCGGYNVQESSSNNNCSDGKDNDCDGKADSQDTGCQAQAEGSAGETASCSTGLLGVCSAGLKTCQANGTWGSCVQTTQSSAEACSDGKDNDCDGQTDCADTNCSTDPACQTSGIPQDYISYWKLDGNASDQKGANNGAINGATTFVSGVSGQAAYFGSVGANIDCGNLNNALEGKNALTFSVWVKFDNPATEINEFFLGMSDSNPNLFYFYRHATELIYGMVWGTLKDVTFTGKNYKVNNTDWHLVTVVYENSKVTSYIDGNLDKETVVSGGPTVSTTSNFDIGGENGGLMGAVDEVVVYGRALTASEVKSIYEAQKPAGHQPAQIVLDQQELDGIASLLNGIQKALDYLKAFF